MYDAVINVQVEVTYEYLRGTRDDGSYMGPSRVLIKKRRMREVRAEQYCDTKGIAS